MLTASERSQRATIAAYARSAQYDGATVTAPARAAFIGKFLTQAAAEADARGEQITEKELHRRAEALRKLYYVRLSFRSMVARRKRQGPKPERVPVVEQRAALVREGKAQAAAFAAGLEARP